MINKLINKNIIESLNKYSIYFATVVIASCLFFSFLTLTSTKSEIFNNPMYDFTFFVSLVRYTTYAVSLILFILINYINNHLLKTRIKEFSVLMILGMARLKIKILC